jgi:hypothetical protein
MHSPSLTSLRFEKSKVISKDVSVFLRAELDCLISLALKPHPVAMFIADGRQAGSTPDFVRIEGRFNAD